MLPWPAADSRGITSSASARLSSTGLAQLSQPGGGGVGVVQVTGVDRCGDVVDGGGQVVVGAAPGLADLVTGLGVRLPEPRQPVVSGVAGAGLDVGEQGRAGQELEGRRAG